jgi:hypothetical protein
VSLPVKSHRCSAPSQGALSVCPPRWVRRGPARARRRAPLHTCGQLGAFDRCQLNWRLFTPGYPLCAGKYCIRRPRGYAAATIVVLRAAMSSAEVCSRSCCSGAQSARAPRARRRTRRTARDRTPSPCPYAQQLQLLGAVHLARSDAERALQAGVWLWQLGQAAAPGAPVAGAVLAWRAASGDGGAEKGGVLQLGQASDAHAAAGPTGAACGPGEGATAQRCCACVPLGGLDYLLCPPSRQQNGTHTLTHKYKHTRTTQTHTHTLIHTHTLHGYARSPSTSQRTPRPGAVDAAASYVVLSHSAATVPLTALEDAEPDGSPQWAAAWQALQQHAQESGGAPLLSPEEVRAPRGGA